MADQKAVSLLKSALPTEASLSTSKFVVGGYYATRRFPLTILLGLSLLAAADTVTFKMTQSTRQLCGCNLSHCELPGKDRLSIVIRSQRFNRSILFQKAVRGAPLAPPSRLSEGTKEATLLAGTEIMVMPNQEINSQTASAGQTFSADVAENLVNDYGQVVIPKGSEAELVIRRVSAPGKVSGTSELALDLQSVKVGGHRYTVNREEIEQTGRQGLGENKHRRNGRRRSRSGNVDRRDCRRRQRGNNWRSDGCSSWSRNSGANPWQSCEDSSRKQAAFQIRSAAAPGSSLLKESIVVTNIKAPHHAYWTGI
jgi:hypothetical protein